ncbi:unnamed protein product [Cylindrotheca closterium]|uniref:non-specific serine/threonine protein kinase n=1 Tax=Cylindrotheca closterium TaxID=2856 RepID=A0AAD2JGT9_9STRA|nr:unnamed protein product [Cylindrotheca closterium]
MIALISYLLSIWEWLMNWLKDQQEKLFSGKAIELDSGIKVRLGRELAQGGYSLVYRATDASNPSIIYAVKCIRCQNDPELRSGCVEEGKIHRRLQQAQDRFEDDSPMYCMPLYGMTFEDNNEVCYMAFPYLPHSLREEVNQRIFDPPAISSSPPPPWSESVALKLFDHLCEAVALMHREGVTHRDIKLENVLFQGSNTKHLQAPILMDFGSAGPLLRSLLSRKDVLEVPEEAGQHTTMPYRPPELFPGELRVGDSDVDYTKVDVWSLGCTLFAILFGASPFECEFTRNRRSMMGSPTQNQQQQHQGAPIKIVDCTQLRVLGSIPKPPPNTAVEKWYSPQVLDLIEFILEKDRLKRPTLAQVQMRVKAVLKGDNVDLEDPIEDLFSNSRHQGSW